MEKESSCDNSHRFDFGDKEKWLKFLEENGYVVIKQV
jgi:hypothetical protein